MSRCTTCGHKTTQNMPEAIMQIHKCTLANKEIGIAGKMPRTQPRWCPIFQQEKQVNSDAL